MRHISAARAANYARSFALDLRFGGDRLVHDDATEEGAKGLSIPDARQLWIVSGWRQAHLRPQDNCHRKTARSTYSR